MDTINFSAPDLTQHPPRSGRQRLGGYVILPRCLDKGRSTVAGKNGEYQFACPLDKNWLTFAGINPDELKKQLAAGKGDGEILEWIEANSTTKPTPWQIAQWSAFCEQSAPTDVESREHFNGLHARAGKARTDVTGWFDVLDLDDFVSFGGKP